jgi:hypothetical protein
MAGRPIKENADYFRHDNDASQDEKLIYLESKFGATGYMFFFKMLEILARSNNFEVELNLISRGVLAKKIGTSIDQFNELIEESTREEVKAFVLKDNILYSKGLKKRLNALVKKREYERQTDAVMPSELSAPEIELSASEIAGSPENNEQGKDDFELSKQECELSKQKFELSTPEKELSLSRAEQSREYINTTTTADMRAQEEIQKLPDLIPPNEKIEEEKQAYLIAKINALFINTFGRTPSNSERMTAEKFFLDYPVRAVEKAFRVARDALGTKINLRYIRGILMNSGGDVNKIGNKQNEANKNAGNKSSFNERVNYKFDPEKERRDRAELVAMFGGNTS